MQYLRLDNESGCSIMHTFLKLESILYKLRRTAIYNPKFMALGNTSNDRGHLV